MTRRSFFGTCGAAVQAAAGFQPAQDHFPGVAYRDYSRCFPDFLRDLAARAYDLRNREMAKLTSEPAIRARQAWVRETFWKLVGGMGERTPLDAKTVGSFERSGYRVEKLVYQSRPRFFITANLYIPAGSPPFPGVLFQMGHSRNGKAYESYQRCCQGLVKLGFLVLAFDPVGQGERVYYPGADPARSRFGEAGDEHTVPGWQMLLYGDTMTRMQVWDAIRSLDYLAAHPLVDPARLGSTGQSGGGTLTMLLSCVDDRLAAAAVASGNTENFACAGFNPPGSTDDAEQDFLGSGPLGFDRWDLLYPLAPKPLLVSVSDKDFFGTYSSEYIGSGWEEFSLNLRRAYSILGHPERLAWADTPLPHSLAYDSRLNIYRWFSRWLKGDASRIDREPPTAPEEEATLRVTGTGSAVRSLGSLTPFALNRGRRAEKEPADLAALLGIARPRAETAFTVLRRVPSREIDIEAVEVASAPRVWLPAWLFVPRGAPRAAHLLLEDGRNSRWHEGELYQELAGRGSLVCAPNLRGLGDLTAEYGRGAAAYAGPHNSEEDYAWASLILGQPMLGQWVTDILALAAALRARPEAGGRRLVAAASGKLTVAALIAASLDRGIDAVYLSGGLVSLQSVVETEDYRCSRANLAPGFLRHTDLPEIAASLGPRKLVLAGAVDATEAPVDPDTVRRLYPSAAVLPRARWDVETLANTAS